MEGLTDYNPKNRIKTSMPINQRSGNYMQTRNYDPVKKTMVKGINTVEKIKEADGEMKNSKGQAKASHEELKNRLTRTKQEVDKAINELVAEKDQNKQNQIRGFLIKAIQVYGKTCYDMGKVERPGIETGEEKIGQNPMKEERTSLKPEKSEEREKKVDISAIDAGMLENILKDTKQIHQLVHKLVNDVKTNNASHYDEFVQMIKRKFEPLVVTVQRLPGSKDDVGKGAVPGDEPLKNMQAAEPPDAGSMTKAPSLTAGESELDKAGRDEKDGKEISPEDTKKNTLKEDTLDEAKRRHMHSEKIALKTKDGRTVWVLRNKIRNYISKGYSLASNKTPSKKKKKRSKPKKQIKATKRIAELYTGSGTHNVMRNDQLDMVDEVGTGPLDIHGKYAMFVDAENSKLQTYQKLVSSEQSPMVKQKYQERIKAIQDGMKKTQDMYNKKFPVDQKRTQNAISKYPDQETSMVERVVMQKNNKTVAVRGEDVERFIDEGYSLCKDEHDMPKVILINEQKIKQKRDEKVKRVFNKIFEAQIESLKKRK